MNSQTNAPGPLASARGVNQKDKRVEGAILTQINVGVKSPLKIIKLFCLWCCNGSSLEARLCSAEGCPSHALRFGKRPKGIASVRPLNIARARCLNCSGGSSKEVAECKANDCPLWIYRSGHNPKLAGRKPTGGRPFVKHTQPESVLAPENNSAVDSNGGISC